MKPKGAIKYYLAWSITTCSWDTGEGDRLLLMTEVPSELVKQEGRRRTLSACKYKDASVSSLNSHEELIAITSRNDSFGAHYVYKSLSC